MPTQGYKTRFQYGDQPTASGSSTWTDFSNIYDLKPPKMDTAEIDTTTLDSPNQWDTSIPGWSNGGEVEIKIGYDKTQQAALFGLFRQQKGFRIMFPDGTTPDTGSTLAMTGWFKTYQNEVTKKDVTYATITVKIVGAPVFTPGT